MESSLEWASQVPLDLSAFLKILDEAKESVRTSPGHGDFVPWHMIDLRSGKIGLVDGELAGACGPLYLDPAQFYLRTRVELRDAGLSQKFLYFYRDLLSPNDKSLFWEELRLLLIQRYIGELWGSAKRPDKLAGLKQLGQEILEDKIL